MAPPGRNGLDLEAFESFDELRLGMGLRVTQAELSVVTVAEGVYGVVLRECDRVSPSAVDLDDDDVALREEEDFTGELLILGETVAALALHAESP